MYPLWKNLRLCTLEFWNCLSFFLSHYFDSSEPTEHFVCISTLKQCNRQYI